MPEILQGKLNRANEDGDRVGSSRNATLPSHPPPHSKSIMQVPTSACVETTHLVKYQLALRNEFFPRIQQPSSNTQVPNPSSSTASHKNPPVIVSRKPSSSPSMMPDSSARPRRESNVNPLTGPARNVGTSSANPLSEGAQDIEIPDSDLRMLLPHTYQSKSKKEDVKKPPDAAHAQYKKHIGSTAFIPSSITYLPQTSGPINSPISGPGPRPQSHTTHQRSQSVRSAPAKSTQPSVSSSGGKVKTGRNARNEKIRRQTSTAKSGDEGEADRFRERGSSYKRIPPKSRTRPGSIKLAGADLAVATTASKS